jgi:two-component system nitrate/nitrite response regulator NarP
MEGNKNIILLLDDLSLEKKIKEVLLGYRDYKLLFSLDDAPLKDDSIAALIITTLLPSLGDNYNPLYEITRKFSWINILVITEPENSFRIFETFKAGANGFCLKSESDKEFAHHVDTMFKLGNSVSMSLLPLMVKNFQKKSIVEEVLTVKEINIAKELSAGLSYKMIGEKVGISIDGVRFHLQKIYRKLEINSKGELIALFLTNKDANMD